MTASEIAHGDGTASHSNDDVIAAKRVPRDKICMKYMISRGVFGIVVEGVFDDTKMAVKMLLSHLRRSLSSVWRGMLYLMSMSCLDSWRGTKDHCPL